MSDSLHVVTITLEYNNISSAVVSTYNRPPLCPLSCCLLSSTQMAPTPRTYRNVVTVYIRFYIQSIYTNVRLVLYTYLRTNPSIYGRYGQFCERLSVLCSVSLPSVFDIWRRTYVTLLYYNYIIIIIYYSLYSLYNGRTQVPYYNSML